MTVLEKTNPNIIAECAVAKPIPLDMEAGVSSKGRIISEFSLMRKRFIKHSNFL